MKNIISFPSRMSTSIFSSQQTKFDMEKSHTFGISKNKVQSLCTSIGHDLGR